MQQLTLRCALSEIARRAMGTKTGKAAKVLAIGGAVLFGIGAAGLTDGAVDGVLRTMARGAKTVYRGGEGAAVKVQEAWKQADVDLAAEKNTASEAVAQAGTDEITLHVNGNALKVKPGTAVIFKADGSFTLAKAADPGAVEVSTQAASEVASIPAGAATP